MSQGFIRITKKNNGKTTWKRIEMYNGSADAAGVLLNAISWWAIILSRNICIDAIKCNMSSYYKMLDWSSGIFWRAVMLQFLRIRHIPFHNSHECFGVLVCIFVLYCRQSPIINPSVIRNSLVSHKYLLNMENNWKKSKWNVAIDSVRLRPKSYTHTQGMKS